jgi:hypothetical protein
MAKSTREKQQWSTKQILNFIQIYPVSEGYLRKIPVERRGKISRAALAAIDIWLSSKPVFFANYLWNRWNVYISNLFALFFFACCILKQNRDLFYFWFCSRNTLLWKDFSCFRRLIKVLKIKWTRWSEVLNLCADQSYYYKKKIAS